IQRSSTPRRRSSAARCSGSRLVARLWISRGGGLEVIELLGRHRRLGEGFLDRRQLALGIELLEQVPDRVALLLAFVRVEERQVGCEVEAYRRSRSVSSAWWEPLGQPADGS